MSRRNIIFAGKILVLTACLIATFVAMHSHQDPSAAIGAPLSFGPPGRDRGPVVQLPAIVARSETGGILVFLRNDTADRQVFLDPRWDQLLVEYVQASGGKAQHAVRLPDRMLGPGEETEPVFVLLSERAGPARVEFVSTEQTANSRLVSRSEVTVP